MFVFEDKEKGFIAVNIPRIILEESEYTQDILSQLNSEQKAQLSAYTDNNKLI